MNEDILHWKLKDFKSLKIKKFLALTDQNEPLRLISSLLLNQCSMSEIKFDPFPLCIEPLTLFVCFRYRHH